MECTRQVQLEKNIGKKHWPQATRGWIPVEVFSALQWALVFSNSHQDQPGSVVTFYPFIDNKVQFTYTQTLVNNVVLFVVGNMTLGLHVNTT